MWGEQVLLVLWKRWFSPARDPDAQPSAAETPELRVAAIQAGDETLREPLIIQYRPFIAKTAGKFRKRYVDPDRDDEFSVALHAFDEAINRYSPASGARFLGFAETVMTRRLIDYARQERRHSATVPYSSLSEDGEESGVLSRVESAAAMAVYEERQAAEERRAEIAMLTEQLALFGIRFHELVDGSPRHRDSRMVLLGIGRRLAATPALFGQLTEKRQLPVKELCQISDVSRKTVERHRKYLIAVSLIAGGPYPCLQEYINSERGGEEESRS